MPVPRRRLFAAVLLVAVTAQVTGCTSWQTVPQPWPAEFRPNRSDPRVRVNLTGGSRIEVDSARALQDSLVLYKAAFTHVVPLSAVQKVETRGFDPLKSLPVLLGLGLAGAAVGCMLACDMSGVGGFYLSSRVASPPEDR